MRLFISPILIVLVLNRNFYPNKSNTKFECKSSLRQERNRSYRFKLLNRNGLFYYRAQQVKLKDSDVYWKRSPEDYCQGEQMNFFWKLTFVFEDNSTLLNYTTQFLGVQYFLDLSIIEYVTNMSLSPSSVTEKNRLSIIFWARISLSVSWRFHWHISVVPKFTWIFCMAVSVYLCRCSLRLFIWWRLSSILVILLKNVRTKQKFALVFHWTDFMKILLDSFFQGILENFRSTNMGQQLCLDHKVDDYLFYFNNRHFIIEHRFTFIWNKKSNIQLCWLDSDLDHTVRLFGRSFDVCRFLWPIIQAKLIVCSETLKI